MYGNHRRPDLLLKTAIAEVKSDSPSTFANILFDGGGTQRSIITQKIADILNFRPTGTDTIRLSSFGNKEEYLCYQHLDRTEILITDSNEKVKLDVFIKLHP